MTLTRNKNWLHPYRRVTFGGITVSRPSRRKIVLGTEGAPESLGSFDDPVDAWKALDAVDLAELETEQQAA